MLLGAILLAACSENATRRPMVTTPASSPTATPSQTATATVGEQAPATPKPERYVVHSGDSWQAIAARYHTSVRALIQANDLPPADLDVGQMLIIPITGDPADGGFAPTPSASPAGPAAVVTRGPGSVKKVALTFDAGADAGYTRLILDVLTRNGIEATFGMTGQWAQANPELVKEIAADGDEFMDHTWDHRSFTGYSTHTKPLTASERKAEIERTEAIIRQLTGETTKPYFRAPYGDQDSSVQTDIASQGYRYDVLWTVDTLGWAGASVGQILARSTQGAVPGAIYVMHVDSASKDGLALQSVIDAIRDKGLGFATVSELLGGD
jgi:peptidoglycan-N-acetylglucosamine deacetylase